MRFLVQRLPVVLAVLVGTVAAPLIAGAQSRDATPARPAFVRGADGRWVEQPRTLTPADVPSASALHNVEVIDLPGGKGVIVTKVDVATSADLRPGDLVDEVQIAGVPDRERQANVGYWPYQVWSASDFYRQAAQCIPGCLVRLRGAESSRFGASQAISGPVLFGYTLVGPGAAFRAMSDEAASTVTGYLDTKTGERFAPAASTKLGRPTVKSQ